MRNKMGIICMLSGAVLLLAALSLLLWNQREDGQAEMSVRQILPQVIGQIEAGNAADRTMYPDPYDSSMTEVEIDGYAYVGYLSIPAANLELPVMSKWDASCLKRSPCRYYGSTKTGDFVICAHNYTRHFGPIQKLESGDAVYFTDMDGTIWKYEVAVVEILPPEGVAEMTAGEYALTLFTCTYSGQSRVTVRCDAVGNGVKCGE